jgi:site-specific recombinase XerD
MLVRIKKAKGNKDRLTLLSQNALLDLRSYYKSWKPKEYLFEGQRGGKYNGQAVVNVVKKAAFKVKIRIPVTPHMLRHSFATHLLEAGVDLRQVQVLLEYKFTKTVKICAKISDINNKKIKITLDTMYKSINLN